MRDDDGLLCCFLCLINISARTGLSLGGRDVHFQGRIWDCSCQTPITEVLFSFEAAKPWGGHLEKDTEWGLSIKSGLNDVFHKVDITGVY